MKQRVIGILSTYRKPIGLCLLLIGMGLAAWLYGLCMDSQMTGFLSDDGVYAITAKALATGKGYTLLHLPGHPVQVKYPILYPLLLSLGWLLNPKFPSNLTLLHWITVAFAIISLPFIYKYLRTVHQVSARTAALITVLVGSNFHFIFYATSLMSEAPYFFFSLLTLFIAETQFTRASAPNSYQIRRLGAVILFSAMAFHTRTIGITLIAAIGLFFLLRKQWKTAALYLVGICLITVVPWGLWVRYHTPSVNDVNFPLAFVYGGYGVEYGIHAPHDIAGYLHAVLEKGIQPLIDTLLYLLFPMAPHWLAQTPLPLMLTGLTVASLLLVQCIHSFKNRQFSPSGIYVALYLGMLALWLYPNQAPRFMAMLLPWLWIYFFKACKNLAGNLPNANGSFQFNSSSVFNSSLVFFRRWLQPVTSLLFIGIFSLWPAWQGYELLKRIRTQHWIEPSGRYATLWPEYQAAFQFIRQHTAPSARIAGMWEPVIYLYTGRSGFVLFASALQPVNGQIGQESFARLLNSLQAYQVDYVMSEPFLLNQEVKSPLNPVFEGLKSLAPNRFEAIYDTPRHTVQIYRISR